MMGWCQVAANAVLTGIPFLAQSGGLPVVDISGITPAPAAAESHPHTRMAIFEGYAGVLIIAFLVSLIATPLMRRLAIKNGVIDRPSDPRKIHRIPVAYLGGVAVFAGIMAGILYSYVGTRFGGLMDFHDIKPEHLDDSGVHAPVPLSIVLGMTVILLVGVIDDVTGISPRVKLGGQLFAAAALAIDEVGVKLAEGLLKPIGNLFGNPELIWNIPLPFAIPFTTNESIPIDLIYWSGTAIIGLAVLGLCNASNLIDGLDGLLSGTTAISSIGLLVIALGLALVDDGPRDSQRIILCMCVLGACLGFLPHNFNPASIFLGDAGSLLLGFCMCVIILMMGDTGKTHLVAAGLIIYAVPIIDTALAIVRRKMEGRSISSADDQHLHHMLKRALGVKGAALALYLMAACFAVLGASTTLLRARVVYFLAMLVVAFIGVTAIKIARRKVIESQAASYDQERAGEKAAGAPVQAAANGPARAGEPAPATSRTPSSAA